MKLPSLILSLVLLFNAIPGSVNGQSYAEFRQNLEVGDKTFSAIIAKDAPTLNRLLLTHKDLIGPTERGLNVLHIAAFVGDEKIFNLLLDHYAGFIHAKDHDGLGVADYALLGRTHLSWLKDSFPILSVSPAFLMKLSVGD